MMNPFDVAFEFLKAPPDLYYNAEESAPYDNDPMHNIMGTAKLQEILQEDPAVMVDAHFGAFDEGIRGADLNPDGMNYGMPYHKLITNQRMNPETINYIRNLGASETSPVGMSVDAKQISNIVHDGEDWKHSKEKNKGHWQYSIKPLVSTSETGRKQFPNFDLGNMRFLNDIENMSDEEKFHRDFFLSDKGQDMVYSDDNHHKKKIDSREYAVNKPSENSTYEELMTYYGNKGAKGTEWYEFLSDNGKRIVNTNLGKPGWKKTIEKLKEDAMEQRKKVLEARNRPALDEQGRQIAVGENINTGEPMDIAMRLLKNNNEKKKIEAYFDENFGSKKVIDGLAENYYFTMGHPLTQFDKMSDRQIKLFSQMIFSYGTDEKPTINSYWREPFQEAGHDYTSQILMGDGMEHIPDTAYDELIRYHQHYNDAVDALPGGAHPPFGSEDHEAHINLWGGTSSAEKSPLTHPHNTAQQKMAADYPHWAQPEKNDFSEGSFQEHYGIEHENRQFTPRTDDGAWQDNIETGKPMDIAFQLLKERKSPEALAHKLEYDKEYQKTPKRVKYREELNAERRRRGIYGSHNGKDVSHTKGGKLTLENQHDNRARHFKSKGTLR